MAVSTRPAGVRTALQWSAFAVAAVFLLAGILGFIAEATSDFSLLRFVGHPNP